MVVLVTSTAVLAKALDHHSLDIAEMKELKDNIIRFRFSNFYFLCWGHNMRSGSGCLKTKPDISKVLYQCNWEWEKNTFSYTGFRKTPAPDLTSSLKGEPSVDISKICSIFGEGEKCAFNGEQIMDYQSQLWFDNILKHRHLITQRRKRCKYFIQQMMTSIALVSEQSFKIMQWQVTELNPFSGGNGILPTAW